MEAASTGTGEAEQAWRAVTLASGFDPDGDAGIAATLRLPVASVADAPTSPGDAEDAIATVEVPSEPAASADEDAVGTVALAAGAAADAAEFQLGDRLGEGGMGVVFRAHQRSLTRPVAVKVLHQESERDPGAVERFVSEARITAILDHPNVVPVYALGRTPGGAPLLAMKEVAGRSWADLLRDEPPSAAEPERLARHLQVLRRVVDAVAFAHDRGVVHRDLKPANVMVGDYGEVYVVDWGLAVDVAGGPEAGTRGAPRVEDVRGRVAGTPAYMAPEMAAGESVSRATDVYLLGAILHELLTGSPPHRGPSVMHVVIAALRNAVLPLRPAFAVGDELVAIATRSLATDPGERFASAVALRDELDRYLTGQAAREESERLRNEAEALLAEARAYAPDRVEDRYRAAFRADRKVQEALQRWSGNEAARAAAAGISSLLVDVAHAAGDLALARTYLERLEDDRRAPMREAIERRGRQLDPELNVALDHVRSALQARTNYGIYAGLGAGAIVLLAAFANDTEVRLAPWLGVLLGALAAAGVAAAVRLKRCARALSLTDRAPFSATLRTVAAAFGAWAAQATASLLGVEHGVMPGGYGMLCALVAIPMALVHLSWLAMLWMESGLFPDGGEEPGA